MNLKRTFAFVAMCYCAFAMNAQNLTSPDGNLKMNFSLNSNGAPVYELFFKDKAVLLSPALLAWNWKERILKKESDSNGRNEKIKNE